MSKPEGIYMSVDFRTSVPGTQQPIDDATVKFLTVHYPPANIGPKAVIAYCGVATTQDNRTPLGDWLRETMRGETDSFEDSMRHLGARLDRDLSRWLHKFQTALIVNVLVIDREHKRYLGGFSNLRQDGITVSRKFEYCMEAMKKPLFGNGLGAARVLTSGEAAKLSHALSVTVRHPRQHMEFLAKVNRHVATSEKSVSPHCHVSFVSADNRFRSRAEVFDRKWRPVPLKLRLPMIVLGADLSESSGQFVRDVELDNARLTASDVAAINQRLPRRR